MRRWPLYKFVRGFVKAVPWGQGSWVDPKSPLQLSYRRLFSGSSFYMMFFTKGNNAFLLFLCLLYLPLLFHASLCDSERILVPRAVYFPLLAHFIYLANSYLTFDIPFRCHVLGETAFSSSFPRQFLPPMSHHNFLFTLL